MFATVTIAFEVIGVAALAIGFVISVVISALVWRRSGEAHDAFHTLRQSFSGVILFGLEILVAADIVTTVTSHPSINDALVLGLIVVIRTILSFSLQIEMDGVAPWRRAFVTGPEVIARAVHTSTEIQPKSSSASS